MEIFTKGDPRFSELDALFTDIQLTEVEIVKTCHGIEATIPQGKTKKERKIRSISHKRGGQKR